MKKMKEEQPMGEENESKGWSLKPEDTIQKQESATEKPSNMGPKRFSPGLSAGGADQLGDRNLGDENSGQIAEGDRAKQDKDTLKSD